MKPKITIEKIMYTPLQRPPYPVWVIDGAHNSPFTQGSICCTGCGKRHQYRWYTNGPWVTFKCPDCDSLSAWYEEYEDD